MSVIDEEVKRRGICGETLQKAHGHFWWFKFLIFIMGKYTWISKDCFCKKDMNKYVHIYLFERRSDREGGFISCAGSCSPKSHCFCSGPGQNQKLGNFICVSVWVTGAQVLGPSSIAFPEAVAGNWIGSRAVSSWPTCLYVECWPCKWQLHLLCLKTYPLIPLPHKLLGMLCTTRPILKSFV